MIVKDIKDKVKIKGIYTYNLLKNPYYFDLF